MARILVISHTPTHPPISGNRTRINSMLRAMQEAGHEICFYLLDMGNADKPAMARQWSQLWAEPYSFPRDSLNKRLRDFLSKHFRADLYTPYSIDAWYRESLNQKFCELQKTYFFDIVLVEYVFFSKAFKCFQESLKILDTHDCFSDRHRHFIEHHVPPSWFYTTETEEINGLKRADIVLAIQEREKNRFTTLSPDLNILCVGHPVKISPPERNRAFHNRLLFVGSKNKINYYALSWFLRHVWPSVRQNNPDVQLWIVGNISACFQKLPEGCHAHGVVDDLTQFYRGVDLVINPVQFGTGLKIKNLEALGYGIPLLTSPVGAEGLENGIGVAFRVANSSGEFVHEIDCLLNDNSARQTLSEKGLEFARHYNQQALSPLLELLEAKY